MFSRRLKKRQKGEMVREEEVTLSNHNTQLSISILKPFKPFHQTIDIDIESMNCRRVIDRAAEHHCHFNTVYRRVKWCGINRRFYHGTRVPGYSSTTYWEYLKACTVSISTTISIADFQKIDMTP